MLHVVRPRLLTVVLVFLSFIGALQAGNVDIGPYEHVCAIDNAGAVWCWGHNQVGQLGNGSFAPESAPRPVQGLGSASFSDVAAAGFTSCAIASGGAAMCWGANGNGALGAGIADANRTLPVAVDMSAIPVARRGFRAIDGGADHFCAIDLAARVWCWGRDAEGQLGNGDASSTDQHAPREATLPPGLQAVAVSTGWNHSCILDASGAAWCWGADDYGQLGDDELAGSKTLPTQVAMPPGRKFLSIAAGTRHSCAIDDLGDAWCWGDGDFGKLGSGTSSESDRHTPVSVSMPTSIGFASVRAGNNHTCAVSKSGSIYCWGLDSSGQLGDAPGLDSVSMPVLAQVEAGTVDDLVVGGDNTCVVTRGGELVCWGDNRDGELGLGHFGYSREPVSAGGMKAVSVNAGDDHTCAIDLQGASWCWGSNWAGQLGSGDTADSAVPLPVQGGELLEDRAFVEIFPGSFGYTCALDDAGTAYCWGLNDSGKLGLGTTANSVLPAKVLMPAGTAFQTIALGRGHACALDTNGGAWCWGADNFGQLGNSTTNTFSTRPIAVDGGRQYTAISAGFGFTCAIEKIIGSVYCWGAGVAGRLGQGADASDHDVPTPLVLADNARFIAVKTGSAHACAIQKTMANPLINTLYCWGEDTYGAVGNDSNQANVTVATKIQLPSGTQLFFGGDLALGAFSTCLQVTNPFSAEQPLPACWGYGYRGSLGDGTTSITSIRTTPVDAVRLEATRDLALGAYHTCYVQQSDDSVMCVGVGDEGQLGHGLLGYAAVPARVPGFQSRTIAIFSDDFEAPP